MAVDRATSTRFDRERQDTEAFLIDGVSGFKGYHDDFGRTAFLGEPDRNMGAIVGEIGKAWRAIRKKMVVGNTYADLINAGIDILRHSSRDIFVRLGVHSVGLWHSADPSGQSGDQYLSTKLEPGMILSVDCPLFDEGIGGSAHFEDLTLITDEGPVTLNPVYPAALLI
jgi:Xaa-Pro aminopeptidase